MIKSASGKLYMLLSACKPDNEKVKRQYLIEYIIEKDSYKELASYTAFSKLFKQYYDVPILQKLDYKKLVQVDKITDILMDVLIKLYDVICYGDSRIFENLHYPDFYSYESIGNIYHAISGQPRFGVNVTNIEENNMFQIFDKDTILSLDDHLNSFTGDEIDNIETLIQERFRSEIYCIGSQEIFEKRTAYKQLFNQKETIRKKLIKIENNIFAVKMVFTFLSAILFTSMVSECDISGIKNFGFILYSVMLISYWIIG